MAIISRPNTYTSSTTISSSEVNDDFDTIYNEFNGSIAAANLATNAITTAKITDANVTTAKLADSSVTLSKIDYSTFDDGSVILTGSSGELNTSNTFSDWTSMGSGSIVAPPSGKIMITGAVGYAAQAAGQTDIEIKATVGTTDSIVVGGSTAAQYTGSVCAIFDIITGLTPGTSYTCKLKKRNSSSVGVYYSAPKSKVLFTPIVL